MFEINFCSSDSNYSAQVSPSTKNEYIYIEKGNTGKPGAQGAPGKDGTSSYIHIKYSNVPSPTTEQMTDIISPYIGIYVNNLSVDSDDPTKYQWKELRGSKGEKGDLVVLHVAYANSANGQTDFSLVNSGNMKYIGILANYSSDAVNDYTQYSWSQLKGDVGDAAIVAVGTVKTGAAGSSATVTNSGDNHNATLNFTIPQGVKGNTGTITIGNISTLAAGANATAVNTGTNTDAVFDFGIPQGVKGDKGDTGDAATITVGTVLTGESGSSATVTNSGTTKNAVLNFKIPKGDKGNTGTITIGNISTLAAGANATVINTGTNTDAIFDFGIPQGVKGDKGDTGDAAIITVGTVLTGEAGSSATVTNSGDNHNAVFNMSIPKGDKGEKGDKGDTGDAATIAVGTVSTGAAGSNASVTNSGTTKAAIFDMSIPKGDKGDPFTYADLTQEQINILAKDVAEAAGNIDLTPYVKKDGTTPMSYLDVGDRKAGSVVGKYSVVEGGDKAFVQGSDTIDISNIASGDYSHAEGSGTTASNLASHAEGSGTTASGEASHAEGIGTTASGNFSHAGGYNTKASSESQTAIGEYNIEDVEGNNLLIVGNGTSNTARSNAFVVGIDGSATVSTELKCQGITDSETSRTVSISDIQEALYKGVKTIATTDWTNKQTTVTVSLPDSMKLEGNGVSTFISAAPESCADYGKFGVYCSAESGSTLTFTCSKVPTVDLNVNILVQYYLIQV